MKDHIESIIVELETIGVDGMASLYVERAIEQLRIAVEELDADAGLSLDWIGVDD